MANLSRITYRPTCIFILLMSLWITEAYSAALPARNGANVSEVSLQIGSSGVLRCENSKERLGHYMVYWNNRSNPSTARNLVMFDTHFNSRGGPGYLSGLYNISVEDGGDFSLIINNVTESDEGKYVCEIVKLGNEPVRITETDVNVYDTILRLFEGTSGSVPCEARNRVDKASMVIWKKGNTLSSSRELVSLHILFGNARRGQGYEEGLFNISDDFSLIIKNVTLENTGRYLCVVVEAETVTPYQSFFDVIIYAQELERRSPTILPVSIKGEVVASTYSSVSNHTLAAESNYALILSLVVGTACIVTVVLLALVASKVILPKLRRRTTLRPNDPERMRLMSSVKGRNNKPIKESEIRAWALFLTERHGKRLENALFVDNDAPNKKESSYYDENIDTLFDIEQMLRDWLKEQTCSYAEIRSKIQALISSRVNNCDYSKEYLYIDDYEVQEVSKYLSPAMEKQLFKILGEEYINEKCDKCLQLLLRWRNDTNNKPTEKRRIKFYSALQKVHFSVAALTEDELELACKYIQTAEHCNSIRRDLGIMTTSHVNCHIAFIKELKKWRQTSGDMSGSWRLRMALNKFLKSRKLADRLPNIGGEYMYKVELLQLAYEVLKQDILPFAQALGISEEKFNTYRKDFIPGHENMGTYAFMQDLLAKVNREKRFMPDRVPFCVALRELGFIEASRKCLLGLCYKRSSTTEEIQMAVNELDNQQFQKLREIIMPEYVENDYGTSETTDDARACIIQRVEELKVEIDNTGYENNGEPCFRGENYTLQHRNLNDQLFQDGFCRISQEILNYEYPQMPNYNKPIILI